VERKTRHPVSERIRKIGCQGKRGTREKILGRFRGGEEGIEFSVIVVLQLSEKKIRKVKEERGSVKTGGGFETSRGRFKV